MDTEIGRPWEVDLRSSARRLSAGLLGGFLPGLVIGGIGGRIAMLILRLTSKDSVRGLETDDGFIIGDLTTDTIFLVVFMAAIGAIGGLLYLAMRRWVPALYRGLVLAGMAATVGGAVIIRPHGVDFTLLEPLSLAVAMFIALPAAWGLATSSLTERLLARAERTGHGGGWAGAYLPLLLFVIGGPFGAMLLLLLVLGWNINRKAPLAEMWTAPAMTWIGRVALAGIGLFALSVLINDVAEVM